MGEISPRPPHTQGDDGRDLSKTRLTHREMMGEISPRLTSHTGRWWERSLQDHLTHREMMGEISPRLTSHTGRWWERSLQDHLTHREMMGEISPRLTSHTGRWWEKGDKLQVSFPNEGCPLSRSPQAEVAVTEVYTWAVWAGKTPSPKPPENRRVNATWESLS